MVVTAKRSRLFSTANGARFTDTLRQIERRAAEGPVTIGELVAIGGQQGHAFVAIFLVLPFLQPIPLPGISSAIGVLLVILGAFVALRRPPWVPRRLAAVVVEPDVVLRICSRLEKLLFRVEKYVRPRGTWLFDQRWFRLANGVLWIVHALVFSLPLPIPLTNAFPATVILLLAIGILEEDFGMIAAAYVGTILNILFFGGLIALPALGWKALAL